jgi:predicted DNA-binding ribbon-helix-helix protein
MLIRLLLHTDLGYSDIGCFGSEIRTPHLDSLARNGARFTDCESILRVCVVEYVAYQKKTMLRPRVAQRVPCSSAEPIITSPAWA